MEVETYEVTETHPDTGLAELEPEALALIEQLGLEGQQRLIATRNVAGGETVATLCPYREMTAEEQRVYGELLPKKMSIDAYDRGPIPLRVLQVAALCTRESWFPKIEVWCPENLADKDPLLVGKKPGRLQYSDPTYYLLARWGDVLAPFDELRDRALTRWKEKTRAKCEKARREADSFLASLDEQALRYFAGEFVVIP